MSNKPSDFPSELVTPVANIQSSLKNLNNILDNSQKQSLQELTEKNNLDSIGKAKLDCVSAFALNTLVWTWVRTQGENPKDVGVQFEINRAKKSMVRLKQIQDKAKRNPVDSQAAKRLVKGSLWTPKDDSKKRSSEETSDNSSNIKKSKVISEKNFTK